MFTASELDELAARIEENGERFYRDAIGKIETESVRELLCRLADQEVEHKKTFIEIKEMLAGETKQDPALATLGREVLRSAMGRHAFSLEELGIDSLRGEEEILRAALAFEEDTLLFYDFISSFVSDPSVCAMLDKIKAEERLHRQVLLEQIAGAPRAFPQKP